MIKNILRICMVQADLFWEDEKQNLMLMNNLLESIKSPVDLIILPEMFTTGFTMNSLRMAVSSESISLDWMRGKATEFQAVVTGSLIYGEGNSIYNRLIWMKPDGQFEYYDKRHLFIIGGEREHFTAGKEKLITELYGWKICPLICYDLRFPVWSRNTENYDLLIYVANWPASRRMVWDTLLRARAIENQSYVCGVNRIGKDGENIDYSGGTVLIDPKGNELYSVPDNKQKAGIFEISLPLLKEFREKFPVLEDRDQFNLLI